MDFPVGRFGWFDYATHDPDAAQKFFAAVFGWTTQTMALGPQRTTLIAAGTRYIAAYTTVVPGTPIYRYSDPYAKWVPYFQVANAHDAAGRIKQTGGKMIKEPAAYSDLGRWGLATTSSGQPFVVWQPMPPAPPAEASWAGGPGSFCWAELYTPNSPGEPVTMMKMALGFTATKSGTPDQLYYLLERGGVAIGGVRQPTPGMPPGWFAWVRVTDCDAVVAKAQQLGAEVHLPPTDTGSGRMALITDPFGASIGILRPWG